MKNLNLTPTQIIRYSILTSFIIMYLMQSIFSFNVFKESQEKINVSGTIIKKWAEGYSHKHSAGEYCYFRVQFKDTSLVVDASNEDYETYNVGNTVTYNNVSRVLFPVEKTKYSDHYNSLLVGIVNGCNAIIMVLIIVCLIFDLFAWLISGKTYMFTFNDKHNDKNVTVNNNDFWKKEPNY